MFQFTPSQLHRACRTLAFIGCALFAGSGFAQTPGVATPAVVASTDGEQQGVRFEVTELERSSGDTLTLKFSLINDSAERLSFGYDYGAGQTADVSTIAGVYLLDAAGKKKYLVVRDAEGKCVCSRGLDDIEPGARSNLWAKFPAPPSEVTKVGIIIPHAIPMDDVPIG